MISGINWHPAWAFQKDPAVRGRILTAMADIGFDAVRLDYAWATLQPSSKTAYSWDQLDGFVGEADALGMRVLLMLYWPPAWAGGGTSTKATMPTNPADFGNILGQAGKRYGAKLVGIEMWNEPDLPVFWSGTQRQFLDLLAGAYPIAKQISPGTTFVSGSPTYLGMGKKWYEVAYADTRFRPGKAFDRVAIHPYMSPSDLPPGAPASAWSINGIPDLQKIRSAAGDTTPLWATEFGWSTHDNSSYGTPAPNYKRGVTEAQQATFTKDAFRLLTSQGVEAAFAYVDSDMSQTADMQERSFGFLRTDYSPKPVVAVMTAELGGPSTPAPEPPPPDNTSSALLARVTDLEELVVTLEERLDALDDQVQANAGRLADLGMNLVTTGQVLTQGGSP